MSSIMLVLDMENDLVHEDGACAKGPYGQQVQTRLIMEHSDMVAPGRIDMV